MVAQPDRHISAPYVAVKNEDSLSAVDKPLPSHTLKITDVFLHHCLLQSCAAFSEHIIAC